MTASGVNSSVSASTSGTLKALVNSWTCSRIAVSFGFETGATAGAGAAAVGSAFASVGWACDGAPGADGGGESPEAITIPAHVSANAPSQVVARSHSGVPHKKVDMKLGWRRQAGNAGPRRPIEMKLPLTLSRIEPRVNVLGAVTDISNFRSAEIPQRLTSGASGKSRNSAGPAEPLFALKVQPKPGHGRPGRVCLSTGGRRQRICRMHHSGHEPDLN